MLSRKQIYRKALRPVRAPQMATSPRSMGVFEQPPLPRHETFQSSRSTIPLARSRLFGKRVSFGNSVSVILIPSAKADYDVETRSRIWYSPQEINKFRVSLGATVNSIRASRADQGIAAVQGVVGLIAAAIALELFQDEATRKRVQQDDKGQQQQEQKQRKQLQQQNQSERKEPNALLDQKKGSARAAASATASAAPLAGLPAAAASSAGGMVRSHSSKTLRTLLPTPCVVAASAFTSFDGACRCNGKSMLMRTVMSA